MSPNSALDRDHGNDLQGTDVMPPQSPAPDEPQNLPDNELEKSFHEFGATNKFIAGLRNASLEDEKERLDPDLVHRLRNPIQGVLELDPDERLAIDIFLSLTNTSVKTYESIRAAIQRRHPDSQLMSYHLVKKLIAELSGIKPIVRDMCINSCLGYTGAFHDLEACKYCGEPRYNLQRPGVQVPRKQFQTYPLGLQLQVLRRSPEGAAEIRYRVRYTEQVLAELESTDGVRTSPYTDFFDGSDYLEAVEAGKIKSHDNVIFLSVDGAQLYQNKTSDCWIGIFIIANCSPQTRYKLQGICPNVVIPGPGKLKNLDNFMYPGDSRTAWDWVVLTGETWERHGKAVANCTKWIPGSFDRPLRNPAEKISSGYKAWEFMLYFFGLGPALLYGILPPKYYRNYCQIVRAIRILVQEEISPEELLESHQLTTLFSNGFELLYGQRIADRLHFVRPVVHTLSHYAPKTTRQGPGNIYSQWALERTIGKLGREIRQHSNPYANLSQQALQRCQVNALVSIIPDLEPSKDKLPISAIDLGGGYRLLRMCDSTSRPVRECEAVAIRHYIEDEFGEDAVEAWRPSVVRWARARLSTGQIAKSLWKEERQTEARVSRQVKIKTEDNHIELACVLYYFILNLEDEDDEQYLAVASFFSPPIDIKDITASVMMAPDEQYTLVPLEHRPLGSEIRGRYGHGRLKEDYDDFERNLCDREANSAKYLVLDLLSIDDSSTLNSAYTMAHADTCSTLILTARRRPYPAREEPARACRLRVDGHGCALPRLPACSGFDGGGRTQAHEGGGAWPCIALGSSMVHGQGVHFNTSCASASPSSLRSLLRRTRSLTPPSQFTNTFYAKYMPIASGGSFNNTGAGYNVSLILTGDKVFDPAKYTAYSPIFLSTTFSISYQHFILNCCSWRADQGHTHLRGDILCLVTFALSVVLVALNCFRGPAYIYIANVALSTEVQTLKCINDSLVATLSNRAGAHIPQLSATVPATLISLEQGPDTKRVKFWQKDKWKLAIRQSKDKNGEVAFDDKNTCHGWCYKFFHGLQEEGWAPDSWGKASLALTSEFRTAVETEYPNLRLCHSHWKADQLAGIVYPSWHSTHGDKEGKVKQEAPDVAFSDDESLSSDDDKIQSAPQPRSTNKCGYSDLGTSGSSVSKRAKTVDAPLKKKVANLLFGKTPKPVHTLTTAGGGPNVTSAPLIPPPSQFTTVTTPVMPPVSQSIVVDPIAKTSPSQIASNLLSPANDADSVPPSTASPSHDGASSLMNLPAITPAMTPIIIPAITDAIASLSTPSHDIVLHPALLAPTVNTVITTTVLTVPLPTLPAPVLPPATSSLTILAPTNPVPTTRKKKWNPDRNSITPRGLCALDYHKKHPQMELADFDGYWRGLPNTEKQAWKTRSENAKVARHTGGKL
ncbi:hypothetical protein K438DRAFT_1974872 [Mycena galopus ATCC 62051]|nr:hypothetical protein K438DRAFT_1974872 [Mycena galopus ATCC 62051]